MTGRLPVPSMCNATASPLSVRSGIKEIMHRIDVATSESPIAVFRRSSMGKGNLVAVFGSTINTQKLIRTDKTFVGMFHRGMDTQQVLNELTSANKFLN